MRSKGWVIPKKKNKETGAWEDGNIIYVLGTVDGKSYRKSTGKEATKINIAWIKKNARDVLLKLIDKEKPTKKIDLESFGMMVLETTKRGKRNINSQKSKIGNFKNHVLPYFKNYSLNDIKTTDIEIWQNKLLETYSSSTVRKCREILGLILKKALADDIITKNYVDFADNIEATHEKKEPYTEAELLLLISNSSGWFKVFLTLVFSTGLRTGEAIGLMWDDIDFTNGFIYLERSVSQGRVTNNDGNTDIAAFIKNGMTVKENNNTNKSKNHRRAIPMDDTFKKVLSEYKINRPHEEWLFVSNWDRCFFDSKSINKYYWKPLVAKLNIKDRTLYATRHTYATIMRNNGADKSLVKSILGHKQSSTILDDVYHTYKSSNEDIKVANNFFNFVENKEA